MGLLWKGADGEDCSAGTTEEFAAAAASEKKDAATARAAPSCGAFPVVSCY